MPLRPGQSQKTIDKNISELLKGPNYRRTMKKHGKSTAQKQAVAIAYSKARERR